MSKRDYYEVLGVSKDAAERDIKKAYKRLAMKYHPDRTQGDKSKEEQFKEVKEAYEILNDDQKRAAYDQYGHAAFEQGGHGGGGGGLAADKTSVMLLVIFSVISLVAVVAVVVDNLANVVVQIYVTTLILHSKRLLKVRL